MATYKVHKTRDYTVMSNHHFKNKNLSLKAVGLLSMMLSLPDDWEFTERGLMKLHTDGRDSIRSALKELENERYLIRKRLRDDKGKLTSTEYHIYETPQLLEDEEEAPDALLSDDKTIKNSTPNDTDCNKKTPNDKTIEISTNRPRSENPTLDNPGSENPTLDHPRSDFPMLDKPMLDNPTILNTNNILNTKPINLSKERVDEIERKIKNQISYDALCSDFGAEKIRGIYLTILELRIKAEAGQALELGKDTLPAALMLRKLDVLNMFHISYVIECMSQNKKRVKNMKNYMIRVILNAPDTMDAHYDNLVKANG